MTWLVFHTWHSTSKLGLRNHFRDLLPPARNIKVTIGQKHGGYIYIYVKDIFLVYVQAVMNWTIEWHELNCQDLHERP